MGNCRRTMQRAGLLPASVWIVAAALMVALAAAMTAKAQDPGQDPGQDQGQPARAIRLSYVDGDVQLAQDGQGTAQQAVANTPLLQGATITTADSGRAEIQFEDGSVARLAPNTALTLRVLSGEGSGGSAEMDLDHGLAYFELQGNGDAGQMSVHFGDSEVTASGFTVLRVSDDTPPGDLAVFAGNAELDRGNGALTVSLHGGESVLLADANDGSYNLSESIPPNSWDTWNTDRDQELSAEAQQSTAPADVGASPSNPAWNDLDSSGTWYDVPDQGYVWSPYEAANAGFDPYGNGSWVYTPGFGYTWASAYSWGYMPYQCGAWNYYNGFGWGWAPGFGGCTPWWGAGYYGGPVIGLHPRSYRPVRRPEPPRYPRRGRPVPLIAVHRMMPGRTADLPLRNGRTPVGIHGHEVLPMRPMPMQSGYGRSAYVGQTAYMGLGSIGAPTGLIGAPPVLNHPGRVGYMPVRPGYVHGPQPVIGNRFPARGNFGIQPGRTFAPPVGATGAPPVAAPRNSAPPPRVFAPPSRPAGGFPSGNPGGSHGAPGGFHGGPAFGGGGGFHGGGGGAHGGGGGRR